MTPTFTSQIVKRKLISQSINSKIAVKPEPVLGSDEFEHILTVTRNFGKSIEQHARDYLGIGEEALRSQILAQLNGHYEGGASGETFNKNGKTDILIREDGKNIFIAECKFWSGAKAFVDTINQLCGYLTWRDTKSAIFLFNRNKDLSKVLAQIPQIVRAHPGHLRTWKSTSVNTEFFFVMSHPDDKEREIFLAIQVYELPIA
jgi:hypothetical protein